MESILVWAYTLYHTCKDWIYRKDSISYYMITEEGKQIPIFHDWDEPIWGFLTVYNKNYNYKYKFTQNFVIADLEIPKYKWVALNVNIHNKYHLLNVNEFLVSPNILFINPIKLWLCHKLQVEPTTEMNICLIDENVNVLTVDSLELYKHNYIKNEPT